MFNKPASGVSLLRTVYYKIFSLAAALNVAKLIEIITINLVIFYSGDRCNNKEIETYYLRGHLVVKPLDPVEKFFLVVAVDALERRKTDVSESVDQFRRFRLSSMLCNVFLRRLRGGLIS
jgi:hypothetical protein